MFTGLIRELGVLKSITATGGATRLEILAPMISSTLAVGDSVAINGICLTVTRISGKGFAVEAVGETRRLTTLGTWRRGAQLHLEPALRVGDALDGHLMQGHIDGVGTVQKLKSDSGGLAVTIAAAADQRRFLVPKGSVAVDGVSLTVDEGPFTSGFTIYVIPHTVSVTRFANIKVGQRVNLEMDVLVKAARSGNMSELPSVEKNSERNDVGHGGLTMQKLLSKGFGRPPSRK
ncbi:MAG: riboflavin synthase [Candidatus Krumholzibacteriia bacterium]|jgi:riboflavin synthase